MSCCSSEGHHSDGGTDIAFAAGITTVYTVTGMTCGHCEQSISAAVSAMDGVQAVKADAATGLVTVVSTAEPSDALIGAAIGNAGYTLSGRASAHAH
ncbi:heavy-metal-associated domain-containing protein (plasmid) [Streptomyces mirabilis]|uniref:heavy-metal-associated domain-containing protein n=1 Tax=Streptomyces mirabilis TaxID=68239 RepID=UPI001BB0B4D9|nr:heavy-metal-associated domain-containing protein [Streptomyces mirabilis]QUW85487.1 heavy-metal-associated domain-containing protein [Streptomyces mirabilis]